MPGAGPHQEARMSQGQAPRLSVAMAAIEDGDRKSGSRVRDFCCTNIKGIVTVVMLFAMLFCVILIVMVNKWQFESEQANADKACIDVAVVGGGLSGTYAAWRLRNHNHSLHLFESSDRIGGRMHTLRLPDFDGINAELGALYYLPQRHRLLRTVIRALRLTPRDWRRPRQGPPTYYLRGRRLHTSDLNTYKLPYRLADGEKHRQPADLRRLLITRALSAGRNTTLDPAVTTSKYGTYLFTQGFLNLLNPIASREAINYLTDTAPWRGLMSNQNAAQLADIAQERDEAQYTLREGMDSVPVQLAKQFKNASVTHAVRLSRRLACMRRERGFYRLVLRKTVTNGQYTTDINDHEYACARKVILALPRGPLERLQWEPFSDETFQRKLRSVHKMPALVVYFVFSGKWWRGEDPPLTDVITDLPVRRVRYMGRSKYSGRHNSPRYLFMVASADSTDVDYFKTLLDVSVFDGLVKVSFRNSTRFIKDVKSQLAEVFRVNSNDIPWPSSVGLRHWGDGEDAAWHLWEKGVMWEKVSERMLRPHAQEQVFIVGSAYSAGANQFWAEGALQSVDSLMRTYFQNDV